MRNLILLLSSFLLFGCASTYNYYSAPPNTPVFSGEKEGYISGGVGATGGNIRSAYSVSDNIAVLGMYHTGYGDEYHASEGELGLGFFTPYDNNYQFSFFAGYGFGRNFIQKPGNTYRTSGGNFDRPFMQFTIASKEKPLPILSFINGSAGLTMKVNYLIYDGYKNSDGVSRTSFNAENFYYEPYVHSVMGGEKLKFEIGLGVPLKNQYRGSPNVRVLPINSYLGMHFVF